MVRFEGRGCDFVVPLLVVAVPSTLGERACHRLSG